MKELEIYIHIPFCVKKCAYCDFLSASAPEEEREEYVKMLCREIEACRQSRNPALASYEVSTVFFGGGTPSILSGEQTGRIMGALKECFPIRPDAEISLEMNPGTVTDQKLASYRSFGINRLSIGLQSADDQELRLLGRIHTWADFLKSYHMAREAGFENINVDLISAIPGQTEKSWEKSLCAAVSQKPEHISAYSLILEPGTPFYEKYGGEEKAGQEAAPDEEKGREAIPDEETDRHMYRRTKEILEGAGYGRYEISNYALFGRECRHNLGYWERTEYLGFGVGASTLFNHARYTNPGRITEYQKDFSGKFQGEKLTRAEEMEEFMFLGLRKMKGISREVFRNTFGEELECVYGETIRKLRRLGMLEESGDGDRIFLTERGIDVSNAVFVEFLF
ncbi:MAG: radical SAM family heme chaperone HemW [Coprococcus sp.]|nr:radical SAM family heme chaperone HemW [Coprococcus sp.]